MHEVIDSHVEKKKKKLFMKMALIMENGNVNIKCLNVFSSFYFKIHIWEIKTENDIPILVCVCVFEWCEHGVCKYFWLKMLQFATDYPKSRLD